jgi:hypothetical protein
VASLVSTEFAIVSGGLACIVGAALLTGLLPGFRRYDRGAAVPTHAAAAETADQADPDQADPGRAARG